MANLLLNLIYSLTAELGSVVSHIQNYLGGIQIFDLIKTFFSNGFAAFNNFQAKLVWEIETFLMGILDAFEYMVNSFLGIGTTIDDYSNFANKVGVMSTFVKTFKAICVVAIILMILFTCFAIFKQEWMNATSADGISPNKNNKGPIIMRLFRGLMTIIILPVAVIIIIGGVNSVLTSFNRALKGKYDATIAANVLSTASYNSNKFRLYAERDKRVPITIQAYNTGDYKPDEKDELLYKIKSAGVQNQLRATAQDLANNTLLSFKDSLTYSNNMLTNSSKYADYYENYICTPEQYEVLADFINYAELTQSNFYIRAVDDEFINWKYVDTTIYDEKEKSLTITYRDASDLNDNGSTNDTYTITYSMSYDVSSPISDALDTIKALLGIGEYSGNVYNEMERDEDSVNIVQWANKKVSIHFSKNFVKENPKTWTATDEIIMYEYYHFDHNNTFEKYNIEDFSWENAIEKNNPVTLDAYIYTYREYYEYADAYSPERNVDCVLINGNYYITEKSEEEEDEYGNPYYVLKNLTDVNFLNTTYTTIFKTENQASIKLSENFDLNAPSTWTYTDQIIVYEYYKDLSYNNEWSIHPISDFKSGIEIPVYVISLHKDKNDINGTPEFYVLINNVYYQVVNINNTFTLYSPSGTDTNFLKEIGESATSSSFYNYTISLDATYAETYGISTVNKTANNFVLTESNDNTQYYYYVGQDDVDGGNGHRKTIAYLKKGTLAEAFATDDFEGYEYFDLKFSSTFDYKDVSTWNYKDYFLFYIYSKYLSVSGVTINQLKTSGGLRGQIGRVGVSAVNESLVDSTTSVTLYEYDENGEPVEVVNTGINKYLYVFKIDENYTSNGISEDKDDSINEKVYLKIDDVLNISEMNILNVLDVQSSYNDNNFDKAYENNLIIDIDTDKGQTIQFSHAETEYKSFTFSSEVNYDNVNTWTVGDFILFYLHVKDIIKIDSIKNYNFSDKQTELRAYNYNALVYKIKGVDDSLRFYQFGIGDSAIFLSENYILNKLNYNSVDTWWNVKLINFITSMYSKDNGTSIIVDDSTIASGIYSSDYASNVFAQSEIISKLVSDYVFSISDSRIVSYDSIATYTYYNNNFDENDISTWTVFDGIIYYVDGKVSRRSYNYSVAYKYNGTSRTDIPCLIMGDKLIELNSTNLTALGLRVEDKYTIDSISNSNIQNEASSFSITYNSINSTNLVKYKDYSSLIRLNNMLYKYTFAETNGNNVLTNFDLFLIDLENSNEYKDVVDFTIDNIGRTFEFEIYRDNNSYSDYYLKICEKDGEVIFYKFNLYSSNAIISLTSSSTISCSNSLFEKEETTYKYFNLEVVSEESETENEEEQEIKFSLLDTIIYKNTSSVEPAEFQVYKLNGTDKLYIYVNGTLIEYNETAIKKYSISNADDISSIIGTNSKEDVIRELYSSYYSSYYTTKLFEITNAETFDIDILQNNSEVSVFKLNDIDTWTPFTIVLYSLGLINENGAPVSINSISLLSTENGKEYLRFTQAIEGSVKDYTIEISSLVNKVMATDEASNEEKINGLVTSDLMKQLLLINIIDSNKKTELDSFNTINSQFGILFNSKINNEKNDDGKSNVYQIVKLNQMSFDRIETWNWYSILYYYYFNQFPSEVKYLSYYNNTDAKTYIALSNGYLTKYFELSSKLFENFSITGEATNVSFNLSSGSVSALAIINYRLTNRATGSFQSYSLSNDNKSFYHLANGSENYFIYGLNANDSNVENKNVKYSGANIDRKNISEMTAFDLFVKSLAGNLSSESNAVIEFAGNDYLFVNNQYINLTKLGVKVVNNSLQIDNTLLATNIGFDISNRTIMNNSGEYNKSEDYSFLDVLDSLLDSASVKVPSLAGLDKDTGIVRLRFSDNFDFSDYSSWKLSDFIIYYIFTQNEINFKNSDSDTIIKNFQQYVNQGYVDSTFCNIKVLLGDNITSYNVLLIGQAVEKVSDLDDDPNNINYIYVDYSIFYDLYNKELSNIRLLNYTEAQKPLKLELTGDNNFVPTITKFGLTVTSEITSQDFKYSNYHYYTLDTNVIDYIYEAYGIDKIPSFEKVDYSKTINLRFSNGFNLNDISTWTILDYIIIYEYTRNVNNNIFEELTYLDLKNKDLFMELKGEEGTSNAVLSINGNDYNLSYWCTENTEKVEINSKLLAGFTILKNKENNKEILLPKDYDTSSYSSEKYEVIDNDVTVYLLKRKDENGAKYGKDIYILSSLYNTKDYAESDFEVINQNALPVTHVNVLEENGYHIKFLMGTNRYNLTVNTSDVTEELTNTRLRTSSYVLIRDKVTSEEFYVETSIYNENKDKKKEEGGYSSESYEVIQENYIPDDLITVEDYINAFSNNYSKTRVELIKTAQTLKYTTPAKINNVTPNNPIILNEFYHLINLNNKEDVYVTYTDFKSNFKESNGNYIKNGDDKTEYMVVEDEIPIIPAEGSIKNVDLTFYRLLDKNVYFNYQISLTRYSNYTISANVLKVNWPQKLMNDMMVTYPDLNWSTLLATDGWIDTLGDYYSGIASGQYISSGNSANITAVGMVLSEFLLSVASEASGGSNYADYTYDSIFDSRTIKALMLSIMGEENYNTLSMEAKVFVDLFNTGFASILDDIANERNIEIKDGKVDNLTMSIYKSFLATSILSSDLAEYLYTIATRVLSQYTIYESLAKASGDYARYYAYFTGQTDENGDIVNAFSYSTFEELMRYENTSLRDGAVPLFTFNWNTAKAYSEEHDKDKWDKLRDIWQSLGEAIGFIDAKSEYELVFDSLDSLYRQTYLEKVYREDGSLNKIDDDDPRYCFLLDVYYTIRQKLMLSGTSQPTYLTLFRSFLTGDVSRWNEVSDSNFNGASVYFQNYNRYKLQLQTIKSKVISSYIKNLFVPLYDLTDLIGDAANLYADAYRLEADILLAQDEIGDTASDIEQRAKDIWNGITNIQVVSSVLKDIFVNNPKYLTYVDSLFNFEDLLDNLCMNYIYSETGDSAAWKVINDTYNTIGLILTELSEVSMLDNNQYTDIGSLRYDGLKDSTIDEVYDRLSTWQNNLGSYINIQKILDKTMKASVTFTLAQYANNYVEQGYSITIRNKSYKLKTSVSTQRLGEYVYGGEFLERFGVPATYTNSEFTGIVQISNAYDSNVDIVKTKLSSFSTLRKFSSKLADYTGKLYLLSNMMDLSAVGEDNMTTGTYNNQDSILMTDYIYAENPLKNIVSSVVSNSNYIRTTQEYLILDYLVQNEFLSYDTLRSLMVVDSSVTLEKAGLEALGVDRNSDDFNKMEKDQKRDALRTYLWYIQTTTISTDETINEYGYFIDNGYSGNYNFTDDTQADRIHLVFKKVILYLTSSVEDDSNGLETSYEGTTISFTNMHFQKLKSILIDALINFEKNENDTGEANTNRYLSLFYLVCSEFDYFYSKDNYGNGSVSIETELGRMLQRVNNTLVKDSSKIVGYTSYNDSYYLRASFRRDLTTSGLLLRLAGLDNRPVEELVDRQYNELYSANGNYDEVNGDTFIICTYSEEEGKYYPVLARNKNFDVNGTSYLEYIRTDFGVDLNTSYYDKTHAYPIIAKGIITGNENELQPTAIRMENGIVSYYRDGIIATSNLGSDAFQVGSIVSEVSTINYVQYVPYSTFSGYGDDWTMYISANNPAVYVNSDADVYFVQYTTNYNVNEFDEYGAISVVGQFTHFYNMDMVFHLLMFLGFVTMMPILFKALLLAMRRILDLMAIVLVGPFAISMNSLQIDEDGKSQAYNTWKDMFTKSLLSVFGIVVSFNLYYILVNTALNMTYVTDGDATMLLISESPVSFLQTGWINAVIKFLFVIVASQMIQSAATMIGKIVTGGRVDNSFASAISNKEPINEMTTMVKGVMKDIKMAGGFVGKIYSGEILLDAKAAAIEQAKQLVPGSAIMRRMANFASGKKADRQGKKMSKMAQAQGVSKAKADKAAREFAKNAREIAKLKREKQMKRANAFRSTFGMQNFTDPYAGMKQKNGSLKDKLNHGEDVLRNSKAAKFLRHPIKTTKEDVKKAGEKIKSTAKKIAETPEKVVNSVKTSAKKIAEAPKKAVKAVKEIPEKIKNSKVYKKVTEDPGSIPAQMFGRKLEHDAKKKLQERQQSQASEQGKPSQTEKKK